MNALEGKEPELAIRSLLSRQLPYLRPSEQKVASFLLYEGAEITDWSLDSLATRAGVSQAAVVRMCQALGYDGFRPFRHDWLLDHVGPQSRHQGGGHPLWPALEALQETVELLDPDALTKAGHTIRTASKVLVYGQGGSGYVARIAAASLTIMGQLAVALGESERNSLQLPVDEDTALIVISHRGENVPIHRFTERCQERGATVIAVTSGVASQLAQMADILLLTGAPVENDRQQLEIAPARVVQMAVLQALVQASRG